MNETNRSLAALRSDLESLYRHAIRAVDPGAALERELNRNPAPATEPVHVLAVGKAAEAMATTAVQWLHRHGQEPVSGLVVSPTPIRPPHTRMPVVVGNHPEPGGDSFAAAQAVGDFVRGVEAGHSVLLLLSGGTTSLMAGPVPGVSTVDLVSLFALVGRAGLDIHAMNAIRKRFVRWGAGRLARDLAPAR